MKKIIFSITTLIFAFTFLFSNLYISSSKENISFAEVIPNNPASDAATQAIGDLNKDGKGIIDCNTKDNPRPCSVADFFKLLTTISKLFLYLVIISIGLGGVVIGVMYPFYGDNPAMLAKIKSAVFKMVTGVLVIVAASALVFALLTQLGANSKILEIIKTLITVNSLETSYAQGVSDQVRSVAKESGGQYVNFFGSSDPLILIKNLIDFLVTFIAVPLLTLAVIWSGFLFIKAQGNEKEIENAKKWMFRSVLGIIIAASAVFISDLFFSSVNFLLNK